MAEQMKCIIISGAPEDDLSYYKKYIDNNSYIICADSGYKKCDVLGINPNLIIGDFDSSRQPKAECEIIRLNTHKDDTDTFHCVQVAIKRGYNEITILGGIGSRFDHTYSNILSLNYCFENGIRCRLVNGKNHITVENGEFSIVKNDFTYFSVFALFDKCEGVSIKGAEYELDNFTLSPHSQLTQSNAFKENKVDFKIKSGKILLVLSND